MWRGGPLFVLSLLLVGPAFGDIIPAEFEAVSLEILPEALKITESLGSFCLNLTTRVKGIGVRVLEGDTFKGTLNLIGEGYMLLRTQTLNFSVSSIEKKTRIGIGDGATFTAIGTTLNAWLGSWVCSHARLLCVQIVAGKKIEEKNKDDNWICEDIRERMVCKTPVAKLPTCKVPAFPEFIKRPTDTYANINDSVVFECAIKPKRAKSLEWYYEGQLIRQGDPLFMGTYIYPGGVLMLSPVGRHHFGLYTCKATDWRAQTIEADGYLEDKKQACEDFVIERPLNRTLKAGLPVLLKCMADDTESVRWYKDGQLVKDDGRRQHMTYGQLLIRKVVKEDEGVYECVAERGGLSCSMKSTIRVFIDASEVCGLPVLNQPIPLDSATRRTGFIVGGNDAPEGSSPWQVMLWFKGTLPVDKTGVALERDFCAGVLIDDQWVATAAHCIVSLETRYSHTLQPTDVMVRLGKRSRFRVSPNERNVSVVEFHGEKRFNLRTYDNDIALLKLAEHVEFSDHIRPICLGNASMNQPQTDGLITGWGKLSEHGRRPTVLQQVTVPIRNRSECRAATTSPITENMFCAGSGRRRGADSCKGDSGGPLSVRRGKKWYLLGLVSWGEGCSRPGTYGFYTKVTNYKNWIIQTTGCEEE